MTDNNILNIRHGSKILRESEIPDLGALPEEEIQKWLNENVSGRNTILHLDRSHIEPGKVFDKSQIGWNLANKVWRKTLFVTTVFFEGQVIKDRFGEYRKQCSCGATDKAH